MVLSAALLATSCGTGGLPSHVAFTGVEADLWRGPAHCEWDGTWFIEVNDESFPVETDGDRPVWVRDPAEMDSFSYAAESDLQAEVPGSADLVAQSDEGYELWFDPNDETLLYLVKGDRVESWALATDYFGCA